MVTYSTVLMCFVMPSPSGLCKSIISFRAWRVVLMVAPRIFVLTPAPCSMGTIRLFSLLPFPQESKLLLLHLWTSPQPKGVAESRGTMAMKEGDGMLSPHQPLLLLLLWESCPLVDWARSLDPTWSWPWCSLCRCLTHLGLHWVLINTAMLSCPSQEDPGEASVLGQWVSLGATDVCDCLHLHVVHVVMPLCWWVGILEVCVFCPKDKWLLEQTTDYPQLFLNGWQHFSVV